MPWVPVEALREVPVVNGWTAIILAAGKGTRMRSAFAKVLHPLCGVPMLEHVIDLVEQAGAARTVVVIGHQAELVRQAVKRRVEFVYQAEQKGTGHAVMQAEPLLAGVTGAVLITYGDTPLYRPETYRSFVEAHMASGADGSILTAVVDDPTGYGRILRDEAGRFVRVVEQSDATEEQARVREINTGTYCVNGDKLFKGLRALKPENAQGEYYLPDLFPWLMQQGGHVRAQVLDDPVEALGVNDRVQLAQAEAILRQRIRDGWMRRGVTIIDPSTTWIDARVTIGADTILFPGTMLEGETRIGAGCRIGPFTHLRDAVVGDGCIVERSFVQGATLPAGSTVGPDERRVERTLQPRCEWLFARVQA